MRSRKKQIALFGGSFNPPHEGHREIVRRIAQRKTIDEVWILPVYKHPFGKKLLSFKKRVSLCRQYFNSPTLKKGGRGGGFFRKIRIKSYEHRPHATGFTIDLVQYLKKKFPTYRFSWVMGADTYRERKKWKDFGGLKKLVRFIIFPRGPRSPIPHISSTEIRKTL
ncbi:MAG: nicotinate-nicotinamide nucleotide adenylyltransferase [Deltaproteobacteria bacterium]|nr:nicotinate-nicotinamide nucleotide adenylyltransferase [Deltaproteobacteria bacterium]